MEFGVWIVELGYQSLVEQAPCCGRVVCLTQLVLPLCNTLFCYTNNHTLLKILDSLINWLIATIFKPKIKRLLENHA